MRAAARWLTTRLSPRFRRRRHRRPTPGQRSLDESLHRLQLQTRRLLSGRTGGTVVGAMLGSGLDFREVRPYAEGDDVRHFDWRVTARAGSPYVRLYDDEQTRPIAFLIDQSASMAFGTQAASKSEVAVETASVLAEVAVASGLAVSFEIDGRGVDYAAATRPDVQRRLRTRVFDGPDTLSGDLTDWARRTASPATLVVLTDTHVRLSAAALRPVATRHEVWLLLVIDPAEVELPRAGVVRVTDRETGASQWLDTQSAAVRRQYEQQATERLRQLRRAAAEAGVCIVPLPTDRSVVDNLRRGFDRPEQR